MSRGYCFTVFKDLEKEEIFLRGLISTPKPKIQYLIFGREICPESKRKHFQGFIYFENRIKFSSAKKLLPDDCHIEESKGSPSQNRDYCSKEKDFEEFGTVPTGAGTRSDLKEAIEARKNGATTKELAEEGYNFQVIKTCQFIPIQMKNTWFPNKKVYWFWGETGTGKSKRAFDMVGEDPYWVSMNSDRWWDGFHSGVKWIILDDIRGDFCKFHRMLQILDKRPFRVEIKGGTEIVNDQNIIITSSCSPVDFYKVGECVDQLLRRIDLVEVFGKKPKTQNPEVGGNTKKFFLKISTPTFLGSSAPSSADAPQELLENFILDKN